jgi:glycerate kinase
MRVLIAPDGFGGTLTAGQAAEAMAAGWSRGAPQDEVTTLPLSDGGPGFCQIVHAALGGDLVPVTVEGPLGEPSPAALLVTPTSGGTVVYLESAQAIGLDLVPAGRRDPTRTTSFGVGELIGAALEAGASRIVIGLGGSSTNDGGAGMLAGLGLRAGVLRSGGGALEAMTSADLAGLAALRDRLGSVDLIAAVDVDVPLLGLHGASAGFAAQKGATPEQAQALERALGNFVHAVGQTLAPGSMQRNVPGLSLGEVPDARVLARLPGAGAAGGLGFGLAALGARLLPGSQVVADAVGLPQVAAGADLLVTGEGRFDWQSLHGKVVAAVAAQGLADGKPVVVVAGQADLGRREWSAAGISGVYAVAERPAQVEASLADPAGTLEARTVRVARTWSR